MYKGLKNKQQERLAGYELTNLSFHEFALNCFPKL